jgi:predicted CoA-binding protein
MRVMIIGASRSREKYGNKAVRAYQRQGHEVVAINPNANSVEGAVAYPDVQSVPGEVDRATLYLPPDEGIEILVPLAKRGDVTELWVNPGAESSQLIEQAKRLGLKPIQACSIMAVGETP